MGKRQGSGRRTQRRRADALQAHAINLLGRYRDSTPEPGHADETLLGQAIGRSPGDAPDRGRGGKAQVRQTGPFRRQRGTKAARPAAILLQPFAVKGWTIGLKRRCSNQLS